MSATVNHSRDGVQYRLVKLPPIEAARVALRVGKLLAVLGENSALVETILSKVKGQGAAASVASMFDEAALVSLLAGTATKVDTDGLYDAALDCVRGKLFAESKLHDDNALNAHFTEYPTHLIPVLAWAVKENCQGFFGKGATA